MCSLIQSQPVLAFSPILACKKTKTRFSHSLQIRAHIPRDYEGRWSGIVDANLEVLKVRIEEVRNKERLERCCVAEHGWNYHTHTHTHTHTYNNNNIHQDFLQLLGMAASTLAFTILACTFCLCTFSFLLHLNP